MDGDSGAVFISGVTESWKAKYARTMSGSTAWANMPTAKAASVSARSQALHDPGMLEIMAEVNTIL